VEMFREIYDFLKKNSRYFWVPPRTVFLRPTLFLFTIVGACCSLVSTRTGRVPLKTLNHDISVNNI